MAFPSPRVSTASSPRGAASRRPSPTSRRPLAPGNHRLLPLLLLFAGLLGLVAGAPGLADEEPIRFFVSLDGDDAAPGTADRPFRTLERARDAARALRDARDVPAAARTIVVRPGRYARGGTFALDARDSGREGAPFRIVADPAGEVVLHGGLDLPAPSFLPVEDPAIRARLPDDEARDAVRVVDLKALGVEALSSIESRGFGRPIRPAPAELFAGGRPLTLARWPNAGYVTTGEVLDPGSRPRHDEKPDRPPRFLYDGTRPERWRTAEDPWAYGYWFYDWSDESLPVAAIDPATKEIRLGGPHRYGVAKGKPYFVENLLEELDQPGEYYVDRTSLRLYVRLPTDVSPPFVLTRLGSPLAHLTDAKHVVLSGFVLETTRGDAVVLDDCEDVRIEKCTIRNGGARAVVIQGGSANAVAACTIHGMGEGGILLEGGDRLRLEPSGHEVCDCEIYDFSRRTATYRPGVRMDGCGHTVHYNHFHHAPHSAVIFGGNDHRIAKNEFDHLLTRTGDGGAVYCGRDWTLAGTVIEGNHFHDLYGIGKWENAVYLDDQASGIVVQGNLIERAHLGLLIGGGRNNVIRNNRLVDCKAAMRFGARGLGWAAGSRPLLEERLAAVPYREEPWRSRFPWLLTLLEEEPMAPWHNVIRGNVLVRSGRIDAHLAKEVREHGIVEGNVHREEEPAEAVPFLPQPVGPR